MKVSEIFENGEKGTYAAVRFSPATNATLEQYTKDNKVPKPPKAKDFHTTLLYSRKHLPNYQAAGKLDDPLIGTPTGFDIWPSQPDENGKKKNVLVLEFSCPALFQRHHKLMHQHGATYDFDRYRPHITLSYDAGDLDPSKLPDFDEELEIVEEYMEDLND